MPYRLPPHHDRMVHIDETSTQSLVCVDNGTISYISIPCFYAGDTIVTRIDIMRIDHFGWPYPGHPDRSFQPHHCTRDDIEVDLEAEGYEQVKVSFDWDNVPSGLTASGSIDGNIIRIMISAACADAIDEDIDVPFSAFVRGENVSSIAMKGIIHILHGPYQDKVG